MIEVRDVSVSYGDLRVLDGVSLSVGRGEFVGLVGPNGAGKTTLLNAVNGVVTPDAGTVLVDGDPVSDLSSRAASRRVATVPQDTTMAFDFAVADVVEMGRTPYHGRIAGDPDGPDAVDRALARTETERFRDRSVGSLSGGERQRVVLARALAQETPALVLDEPTASLDVNHQVRTLAIVRDLTRGEGPVVTAGSGRSRDRVGSAGSSDPGGRGALAAIHDLDLAARFCDRLALLADGGLLTVGPPGSVLTDEHVRTAFDTAAAVVPDPVTGTPSVTALADPGGLDARVHVAGSGRQAARTIATLREAGATVTAGVLPDGDLATETARQLGVETVTAPPFAPLSAPREAAARDLLDAAAVVVLAGGVPPTVRALARERDAIVRVHGPDETRAGGGASGGGDDGGSGGVGRTVAAEATADPSRVVDAVRRVARRRLAADD